MKPTTKVRIRRGNVANLPALLKGEIAFCIDSKELYVGDGVSNVRVTGASIAAGDYGDITVDALGTTWTINDGVIDGTKLAPIPQFRILGRIAAGVGDVGVITIADLMTFADNFVAFSKLATMNPGQLLGRNSAGIGNVEAVTVQQALNNFGFSNGEIFYANAAGWTRLSPAGVGSVLNLDNVGGAPVPRWKNTNHVLCADVQTSGTNAGTFTAGSWVTRVLNTKQADVQGTAGLSGNVLTLPAGTYKLHARAPGANINAHQVRLWDTTAGAVIAYGTVAYAVNSVETYSDVYAIVTFAASHGVRLEHQCQTTRAGDGLGFACGFGGSEVYAVLEVEQIH